MSEVQYARQWTYGGTNYRATKDPNGPWQALFGSQRFKITARAKMVDGQVQPDITVNTGDVTVESKMRTCGFKPAAA